MRKNAILTAILLALACGLAAPGSAAERQRQPAPSATPAGLTAARKAELDQAIARNRMGTLVIQTAPGAEVRVEQLRHEFWFGAALSEGFFGRNANTEDAKKYRETFLANFNSAVTENALKWHNMERQRGQVNYASPEAILKRTEEHGIPLRGHNIFWGVSKFVQDWIKALDNDELRATLKARALDVARRYRGRFAEYDLNNEMIHGNYYEQRLGPDITRQMAAWVREGDPNAVLCLNDYDILTGKRVADYAALIRKLLGQGVPVGVIGVQGHSHGMPFDAQAMQSALDQLAQFKLPIRVTEFNMPGQNSKWQKNRQLPFTPQDEAAQARALADYYRICFAHPAVSGILMWGFWEGADWIPASALYRRDWSPRPAAQAYRDLVFKEWWTRWNGKADAQGRCEVRAFYGRYRVTVGAREAIVELKRAEGEKAVSLK
jgi:GH35 family endo-1,4-beta-xylanase